MFRAYQSSYRIADREADSRDEKAEDDTGILVEDAAYYSIDMEHRVGEFNTHEDAALHAFINNPNATEVWVGIAERGNARRYVWAQSLLQDMQERAYRDPVAERGGVGRYIRAQSLLEAMQERASSDSYELPFQEAGSAEGWLQDIIDDDVLCDELGYQIGKWIGSRTTSNLYEDQEAASADAWLQDIIEDDTLCDELDYLVAEWVESRVSANFFKVGNVVKYDRRDFKVELDHAARLALKAA